MILDGKKSITVGSVLADGWKALKKDLWFFIGIMAVYLVANITLSAVSQMADGSNIILRIIIGIILFTIQAILYLGLVRIGLSLVDGRKPPFTALFSSYPIAWKYVAATILLVICIVILVVGIIVPTIALGSVIGSKSISAGIMAGGFIMSLAGIAWLVVTFFLYSFFIVERGMGPVASLMESKRVTRGSRWRLLGLLILLVGLNIIGLLCFFIGLLITIPISIVSLASVYRSLAGSISEQT